VLASVTDKNIRLPGCVRGSKVPLVFTSTWPQVVFTDAVYPKKAQRRETSSVIAGRLSALDFIEKAKRVVQKLSGDGHTIFNGDTFRTSGIESGSDPSSISSPRLALNNDAVAVILQKGIPDALSTSNRKITVETTNCEKVVPVVGLNDDGELIEGENAYKVTTNADSILLVHKDARCITVHASKEDHVISATSAYNDQNFDGYDGMVLAVSDELNTLYDDVAIVLKSEGSEHKYSGNGDYST
jgi:hypothetical protein